jgi:di/tricarboxylate transporter
MLMSLHLDELIVMMQAMERWKLHVRLALNLLALAGNRPYLLLLSFMLATVFLSMFISNTATASLMVPILVSMLERIREQALAKHSGVASETTFASASGASSIVGSSASPYGSISEPSHADHHHHDQVVVDIEQVTNDDDDDNAPVIDDDDDDDDDMQSTTNSSSYSNTPQIEPSSEREEHAISDDEPPPVVVATAADTTATILEPYTRYAQKILLGVAYAASIGGSMTLIGTGLCASLYTRHH